MPNPPNGSSDPPHSPTLEPDLVAHRTSAKSPSFDPGLTQKYTGALLRSVNKDGSFNIRRRHSAFAGDFYTRLVAVGWSRFLVTVAGAYMAVNLLFATIYTALGPNTLRASDSELGLSQFTTAFFFSVHTLTTVGYGDLYPLGFWPNTVAAIEAALGLMGFALATGLLYARFSRPTARLRFSRQALMAPFNTGTSLQFRIANERANVLMEVSADVMLMTVVQGEDGQLKRQFQELKLERDGIFFLALTWTLVHPIDETSPLWGKAATDLEALQAELIILIRSFDDSFSQVVHSRHSYVWKEIQWSARFAPAFEVSKQGHMVLDVGKISDILPVEPT
ncbi:MAG: ion channel [Acidobacteriota bacterium]